LAGDGQCLDAAQHLGLAPLHRVGGERQRREPAGEGAEGDLAFEAGERRPQAEVDAEPESDGAIVGAAPVEAGPGGGIGGGSGGPAPITAPPRPPFCARPPPISASTVVKRAVRWTGPS